MANHEQINVTSKCRQFLKYMSLGLKIQFRIGRYEFPYWVSCSVASFPMILFTVMEYWTVYDIGLGDFLENGNVFFISLGLTQILLIYICLANNNDLLIETIGHIQQIVNQSKI